MNRSWLILLTTGFALSVGAPLLVQAADEPTPPPSPEDEALLDEGRPPPPPEKDKGPERPRHGFRGRMGGPGRDEAGPGGPDRDRRFGGIERMANFSERIDKVLEFLKEHYPEMYEKLTALRKEDPRAFRRQLMRLLPRLPEFMMLVERDPEMATLLIEEHKLEMEIREVAHDYRHVESDDERASLKQRLASLVGEQFDIRQTRLKRMIEDLERQLELKKKALAQREERKKQLIEIEVERRLNPDF
jgi:hypothetical protein